MLDDRDYMRPDSGGANPLANVWHQFKHWSAVKQLITVTVIISLLQWSFESILIYGALIPETLASGQIWRLFTTLFLHGGFFHLLFNMMALYFFGPIIEQILGRRRFLHLYFLSGLSGSLLSSAVYWGKMPPAIIIGASSAVVGVVIAACLIAPQSSLFVFPIPIPIKLWVAKYLLFAWEGIALLGEINGSRIDSIAHAAHFGGIVFGWIYLRKLAKYDTFQFANLLKIFKGKKRPNNHGFHFVDRDHSKTHGSQSVDEVLDKMNKYGPRSLTPEDKAVLEAARRKLKGK